MDQQHNSQSQSQSGDTLVKLGPVNTGDGKTLSPMMKEISSRKLHPDLAFICDGGTILGHKFFMAAQSKFLKGLLPQEPDLCEVYLPGVSIHHMKKAIKFMYSGKIKISKKEIESHHVVWYIHHILKDLLQIDAKLNLDPSLLRPPPSDNNGPGGQGSGGGSNNNCDNDKDGSNNLIKPKGNSNVAPNTSTTPTDIDNSRQNSAVVCDILNDSVSSKPLVENSVSEPDDSACQDSSVKNVKVEMSPVCEGDDDRNVPTPDIIDLLDSDDEDDVEHGTGCGNLNEESFDPVDNNFETEEIEIEENPIEPVLNKEELTDKDLVVKRPMSRRRKSREVWDVGPAEKKTKTEDKSTKMLSEPIVLSHDILKVAVEAIQSPVKGPEPTSQPVIARKSRPPSLDDAVTVMVSSPAASVSSGEGMLDPLSPGSPLTRVRRNSGDKVRKHNHVPWTMSGLQRPDTINDINEDSAVHACHVCDAKFEKIKSLKIHMGRNHNEKARVPCPEGCGKMLTTPAAIKKHLLSHRPEEEWPFECPLCHKKFQARGDIPKHLMTKLHEKDNIPPMGSKGWFDLIYHDDPSYDYESHKRKLNKMKATGMQPSSSSGSVVVSSDSLPSVPNIPGLDLNSTLTLQLPVIHVDSQYNFYHVNQQ